MSNRSGKKSASAVLMRAPVSEAESERRLRPVLECFQAQNYKQGLKLANQAIQKRPGWPAARALRAIAMLHLRQRTEALAVVRAVCDDLDAGRVPLDEDAATKLQLFYREIRSEECAAQIFEKAWLADQSSVRLAESAYGLYMRSNDFASAQKVAIKLQRAVPRKVQRYALWIAAASWLELHFANPVCAGTDTVLDARMLKLASMRVHKALAGTSIPSSEDVRFAVRLYLDAGNFGAAKELLSRPRIVMDMAEVLQLRALVAKRSGVMEEASSIYQKLLTEHDSDDWSHWVQYFKCIHANEEGRGEAWTLVEEMCAREKSERHPKRGPFLARMELFVRDSAWEPLHEAVVDYFAMFSTKLVCAQDIRPFVSYLVSDQRADGLFEEFSVISGQKDAISRVSLSWLLLWFNRLDESAKSLFNRYSELVDEKMDPNERQMGDDFLLMAAHKLLPPVFGKSRYENATAVFQAIAILEAGLTRSPENYHFKLLLIVLYTEIKYIERAFAIWSSLGIKHIQLATLTHLVLTPLFVTANQENLKDLLTAVDSLWRECDKDIPEGISRAFQAGSINAAIEFLFFRRRVERSVVLAEAMHVQTLTSLGRGNKTSPYDTESAWSVIGESSRFSASVEDMKKGLIANHDTKCLSFWHIDRYERDERMKDEDDPSIEFGVALCPDKLKTLFSGIKAARGIVAMARGIDPVATEPSGNPDDHVCKADISTLSNGGHSCNSTQLSLSRQGTKRVEFVENFSNNLYTMRKCLLENDRAGKEPGRKFCSAALQEEAKSLALFLLEDCECMHARFQNWREASEMSSVLPAIIEECGQYVCQVLVLLAVGIQSIQPLVSPKKRQGRKGGQRTSGGHSKSGGHVENVQAAIGAYKQAALVCCKQVASIFESAEQSYSWEKSVRGGILGADSFLSFLPDSVKMLSFEGDNSTSSISGRDLVDDLFHCIGQSHSATIERLSRLVSEITQTVL